MTTKNTRHLKRLIKEELVKVLKEQRQKVQVKGAPGAEDAIMQSINNLTRAQAKLGMRMGSSRPMGAANMFQGAPEQNFQTLLKIQQFLAYLKNLEVLPYHPGMPRVPSEAEGYGQESEY